MALSNQLRNISNALHDQANQQQGVGMAQVGMQAQQTLGQQAPKAAGPTGKRAAQQLSTGIAQAGQQVKTQAAGQLQQNLGQLAGQGLQQQAKAQQQQLTEKQMLSEQNISDLQREKKLRQNSEALRQAKQLQQRELDLQQRLTSSQLDYDNSLSFLTRKQREDLSSLGQYTKQMLFDQRLTFARDDMGRKFSNMQQLADYTVLAAESEVGLQDQMREMTQASEKEYMALQHAHKMITSKMEMAFERAEKQKDYAMTKKLAEYKKALEEKMKRKQAQSGMISNIIIGGAMIAGSYGGPQGAMAAGGIARSATGAAEAGGVY